MKNIIIFFLSTIFTLSIFGQTKNIIGNISTIDTADLTILNIYPDSFPNVSVVFKAESRNGEPVWDLTKEKMTVQENSQNCDVISLEKISENKPINIGIVIDHSSSMLRDIKPYDQNKNLLYPYDTSMQFVLRKNRIAPIDNAKSAVINFVSTFDIRKDYISVIGFSNIVDKILPLTQDTAQINSLVNSMRADFSTALYDAMITGIDEINKTDGVKVLVVLTDGHDNLSKSKYNDVIDKANKDNIPVYIIGLGYANIDVLTLIAKSTKGQFYFTQSSNSLNTVYTGISKQVQAFYNLIYSSSNFSSADSTRQIELTFDIDSIYLVTNPASSNFPTEVVKFVAKKEKRKQYLIGGGIALAVLITTGTLLFFFQKMKRNKNQPNIKKLFPNPAIGNINIDFKSGIGQLQIVNLSGQIVKTIEINGTEKQFDLSDLQAGNYIAVIQANGQRSNAIKFIIQK